MPKLSVCIPTYNSARFLPDAIESVLGQDFQDFELVIGDNVSRDNTAEVCARYRDPRIRYVRFEEFVGQGGNWNRCVALARGEYVALLHADDWYLPGFLSQRVRALDENPHVGLAFGAVRLVNGAKAAVGTQVLRDEPFVCPAPEFFKDLLFKCVVSPVSPVVRASCYARVGKFNETRVWGVDWEMWLRIAAYYGVAYSPEVLACYRLHDDSGTSSGLLQARNGADDLEVLHNMFRLMEEEPSLRRFRGLRRGALHAHAMRTLAAAGHNCDFRNLPGVRRNLWYVTRTDPRVLSRPTFWALALSCVVGPWVYQAFRRVRPVRAA